MNKGFEASNCYFNEEIRLFGSILELECMHMHIMRVGLKGSNFQRWPSHFLLVVLPRISP